MARLQIIAASFLLGAWVASVPQQSYGESPKEKADRLLGSQRYGELLETLRLEAKQSAKHLEAGDESLQEIAAVLGTHELLMGNPIEAEVVLRSAVERAVSAQSNDRTTAHLLNELGVACFQLAKFDEALKYFEQAHRLHVSLCGPMHVDTLQSLRNVAFTEEALGNHVKSRAILKQCYDNLEKLLDNPSLPMPSSTEVLLLIEPTPRYPRVVSDQIVAAPAPTPPRNIEPTSADLKGWVLTLERLHTIQQSLALDGTAYGDLAARNASKAFGDSHFQTFLVLANCRPSFQPQPQYMPPPFSSSHPVMATIYLKRAYRLSRTFTDRTRFEEDPFSDMESAVRIRRNSLGKNHPLVANVMDFQGSFAHEAKQFALASKYFSEAYDIRKSLFPSSHPSVGMSLAAMGVTQFYLGDVPSSVHHLKNAHDVLCHVYGRDSSYSAEVTSDLGAVAHSQGDYALARNLLEESVGVLKRTKGETYFGTQIAMSNLAVIQAELGDYDSAANHFTKLVKSSKSVEQADRARVNLAIIARYRGRSAEAEAILKSVAPGSDYGYAARRQLGALYRDLERYEESEKILKDVLAEQPKDRQDSSLKVFPTVASLGLLYLETGRTQEAIEAFKVCVAVSTSQLGTMNRHTAESLRQLGTAYLVNGDFGAARKCLEDAVGIKVRWVDEQLPFLSEADAVHFAASLGELDPLLSVARLDTSFSAMDAYRSIWSIKSAATRSIAVRRKFRTGTLEDEELVGELRQVKSQLSRLVQSRELLDFKWQPLLESKVEPNGNVKPMLSIMRGREAMTRAEFEKQINELTLSKERLERVLATKISTFRLQRGETVGTPQELCELLPNGVAVVDFVKVKTWNRTLSGVIKSDTESVYEAFVLRSTKQGVAADIKRILIGPSAPVDDAIARFRAEMTSVPRRSRGLVLDGLDVEKTDGPSAGEAIRKLLWEKLSGSLKEIETCIVIPDGDISLLPFAAIQGSQPDTFLAEEMCFSLASFGQQLLSHLKEPRVGGSDLLVVGGVAFDTALGAPSVTDSFDSQKNGYRTIVDSQSPGPWTALPGSGDEVKEIMPLWRGSVHVLSGSDATKEAVINGMRNSRFVHLATHGYFSQAPVQSVLLSRGQYTTLNGLPYRKNGGAEMDLPPVVESIVGRNPLVLSGIVLAGANAPEGEGVLTAEELVDLDLSNTELVTLSACETALGKSAGGEGVFGLQRAVGLAGAKSSIASLWKVDDNATKVLMVEFYKNLWQRGMSRSQALRAAQVKMLRGELPVKSRSKDGRIDSFYWAAFTLSGDWR